MSGNVWEWCSDMYTTYSINDAESLNDASTEISYVYRGGGYNKKAWHCRSTNREMAIPSFKMISLGFRIALTLR